MLTRLTSQIILKDKDDIDALSPTNSSPKQILLRSTKQILLQVSKYMWQVLKIKISEKFDFPI